MISMVDIENLKHLVVCSHIGWFSDTDKYSTYIPRYLEIQFATAIKTVGVAIIVLELTYFSIKY